MIRGENTDQPSTPKCQFFCQVWGVVEVDHQATQIFSWWVAELVNHTKPGYPVGRSFPVRRHITVTDSLMNVHRGKRYSCKTAQDNSNRPTRSRVCCYLDTNECSSFFKIIEYRTAVKIKSNAGIHSIVFYLPYSYPFTWYFFVVLLMLTFPDFWNPQYLISLVVAVKLSETFVRYLNSHSYR